MLSAVDLLSKLTNQPTSPVVVNDPATVFGQSATPLPTVGTPVHSTAGVALPMLAPEGLPGTSAGQATALPGLAQQPAQGAVAGGLLASVGLTSPAPSVDLDSAGLPWDERIHSGGKSKKKDGTWTARKGLNDEAKVKAIEAELRQRVAASQGQQLGALVQQQANPTDSGTTPLPGLQGAASPLGAPLGNLPLTTLPGAAPAATAGNQLIGGSALPGLPVGTAAAVSADPQTFEQLMPRVTQAMTAGTLPPTALQQVCQALGLPSIVALQQQPAYVPHAWATLRQHWPSLQ